MSRNGDQVDVDVEWAWLLHEWVGYDRVMTPAEIRQLPEEWLLGVRWGRQARRGRGRVIH